MKIIIDTSIWSLVLRRDAKQNQELKTELFEIIKEVRVQLIGPIRQEILSGIKSPKQFEELKIKLSLFTDLNLSTSDFELAAEYFNLCRKKGVQGSNTDFLICAAAANNEFEIFTKDKGFENYKKYLPIKLYKQRFAK